MNADYSVSDASSAPFLKPVVYEPCHEKTCFSFMRTTKVQISLRICAVRSAPSLFAA